MRTDDVRRIGLFTGIVLWIAGTALLRTVPAAWLPASVAGWGLTYLLSCVAAILAARWGWRRTRVPPDARPVSAALLVLPTLALDPWSALLFPRVFPNLSPDAAAPFAGWMLAICAGVVAGACIRGR